MTENKQIIFSVPSLLWINQSIKFDKIYCNSKEDESNLQAVDQNDLGVKIPVGDGERRPGLRHRNL